jgi:hypothetical protein
MFENKTDVYVIMFGDFLFEPIYFTNENAVSRRVEYLRKMTDRDIWYKKLKNVDVENY